MKVTDYFLNFDFNGRARRRQYWANVGCWLLVYIVLIILAALTGKADAHNLNPIQGVIGLLLIVAFIVNFIDNLAVLFRRAHDTGKTGWVFLILFVPLANLLGLYWFWIEDSQAGPNKYGQPAKQFAIA